MDPLTALTFILAALSILFLLPSGTVILPRAFPHSKKIIAGQLLAVIVLMIGGVKIIDQDIQMTVMTSFCFILSGASLLFLNSETKSGKMPAHFLALAIGLFGLFSMGSYLYGVPTSYGLFRYTSMAIHTAAGFFLLSFSMLFANPAKGIMLGFTISFAKLLNKKGIPGKVAELIPVESEAFYRLMVSSVKVTRDTTERKKFEQQLLQFNEYLEVQVRKKTAESLAIFERITDAFVALDKNLCYTYLNKKAGEMLRHDPESLIGKRVWDVFPEAIGSATYHAINKAMAEQKNSTNTDYYEPFDLWQENHLYPSSDGLSIFIRDITAQKRREQEIIDYKYALDQTSIISVTDQNGVIKHVNENFCKNSKFTEAELIGQDHRILQSGYHSREFMDDLKGTISAGGIWKGEICNKAKDGTTYWVDTTIIPFINEKGTPYEFIAIRADITERKSKEHELKKSYQEIRQLASHLQEIREEERAGIAREIHDELGQQLTGLKMDMSWVLKKIGPREDDQIRQKINGMLELSDTAVKTIRRIATDLRPSILDDLGLVAAIEWQCQEFQKRFGTSCECTTTLTAYDFPSPIAVGLFRICQESLTNIARHAEAKHVYITLDQQENRSVQLIIQDDGKGFIPDEIGTKKTLGLLGMRERTLMMGGEFGIISKPGEGTTLVVTIPATIHRKKS